MNIIYTIAAQMKNNLVGGELYYLLNKMGIQNLFRKHEYKYRKKKATVDFVNPTNEMLNARQLYSNKQRVDYVLSLLADDMSKQVFMSMLKFRMNHDFNEFPVYNADNQYFPKDIIKLGKEEVFIDCGAFRGDTERMFYHCANSAGGYKRIVCFEPESDNFQILKKHTSNHKNVVLVNKGVWDSTTQLHFSGESVSGKFDNDLTTGIVIPVVKLDDVSECADASFVKMDIEGSEYNALLGMKNIIEKNKPKLAICIYHSNEDMLRLIELIHKFDSTYKLYVRQHCYGIDETVLYAIQK